MLTIPDNPTVSPSQQNLGATPHELMPAASPGTSATGDRRMLSLRLTAEARELVQQAAAARGLSQAGVLEILLREDAVRRQGTSLGRTHPAEG